MTERTDTTVNPDDPFNEAVATTGLFLLITAIIAVAFALASWGMAETAMAALAAVAAVVSFAASIFCFKAQASDATAEISA